MNAARKSASTSLHDKDIHDKDLHDRDLFDRKFVIAACLIGAAYAAIIVLVERLIGKEAAGVAAAALTALATAIFSRFEKLQFVRKARAATVSVAIPHLSIVRILLIGFCGLGLQAVLGIAIGLADVVFHLFPATADIASVAAMTDNRKFITMLVPADVLSFFTSGFLASRFFKSQLFAEVAIASFFALIFNNGLPLILALLQSRSAFFSAVHALPWWPPVAWLLYLASALFGAWLGARQRTQAVTE
jgi:hypothetical protein